MANLLTGDPLTNLNQENALMLSNMNQLQYEGVQYHPSNNFGNYNQAPVTQTNPTGGGMNFNSTRGIIGSGLKIAGGVMSIYDAAKNIKDAKGNIRNAERLKPMSLNFGQDAEFDRVDSRTAEKRILAENNIDKIIGSARRINEIGGGNTGNLISKSLDAALGLEASISEDKMRTDQINAQIDAQEESFNIQRRDNIEGFNVQALKENEREKRAIINANKQAISQNRQAIASTLFGFGTETMKTGGSGNQGSGGIDLSTIMRFAPMLLGAPPM